MGFDNGLSVDSALMNDLGSKTGENAREYNDQLTSLRNNVESLRAIWHGPASNAFDESYRNQDALFKEFEARLEELGTALQSSAGNFENTESELTDAGRRLY